MGACQSSSSTQHAIVDGSDPNAKYYVKKSTINNSQPTIRFEVADPTTTTTSQDDAAFLSPTKTVSTMDSVASPWTPNDSKAVEENPNSSSSSSSSDADSSDDLNNNVTTSTAIVDTRCQGMDMGCFEGVDTRCFERMSPRKLRQEARRNASAAAATAEQSKSGGVVEDGREATLGTVAWKTPGENNQVGSSGERFVMSGGATDGEATIGSVPWKSGDENNAIRADSSVRYEMQGGPLEGGALASSEQYETGKLVPGKDFTARTFVPVVLDATTGAPSFAVTPQPRGKIIDEVDDTLCSLCNKASLGVMRNCECGREDCDYICHTACASRIQPAPSLSYPGTPAPRLPLILCPAGVSYALPKKKKVQPQQSTEYFLSQTKVAILKDSAAEGEIPRGIAENKAVAKPTDFTAETKVKLLPDTENRGIVLPEATMAQAQQQQSQQPPNFAKQTKVALLRDSDDDMENDDGYEVHNVPDDEAGASTYQPSHGFTAESFVAQLRNQDTTAAAVVEEAPTSEETVECLLEEQAPEKADEPFDEVAEEELDEVAEEPVDDHEPLPTVDEGMMEEKENMDIGAQDPEGTYVGDDYNDDDDDDDDEKVSAAPSVEVTLDAEQLPQHSMEEPSAARFL